jgi:hypothetical protein
MRLPGALLVVAVLGAGGVARGDGEQAERALYDKGRAAYDHGDFSAALELFKKCYLRSHRPALLYNMALAEEQLGRPGDAAATLRSYLRVVADTPDRAAIEEHIRSLDESQRLMGVITTPAPAPPPTAPSPPHRSRTGLVAAIVVGSVVAVALGVGLGVGLGTRGPSYSPADVGPLKSTP